MKTKAHLLLDSRCYLRTRRTGAYLDLRSNQIILVFYRTGMALQIRYNVKNTKGRLRKSSKKIEAFYPDSGIQMRLEAGIKNESTLIFKNISDASYSLSLTIETLSFRPTKVVKEKNQTVFSNSRQAVALFCQAEAFPVGLNNNLKISKSIDQNETLAITFRSLYL